MAVVHDASSESHTGTTGSASEASFTWDHTPVGTPRGILIFVNTIRDVDYTTSVTYGGVNVPIIPGAYAVDTVTEPGFVQAYFLGSGIPTGTQAVIVNRTNNTSVMYAVAISVTATENTIPAHLIRLHQSGTGAYSEQNIDDGSPGTNSVRYAGGYWGGNDPVPAGANSTSLQSIDFGSFTFHVVRETTAGQGARPVGFNSSGGTDDRAGVHLAIREVIGDITASNLTTGTDSDGGSGSSTASITLSANRLILLTVVSKTDITTNPNTPTATSTGATWEAVNNIVYDTSGTSRRKVSTLRTMVSSGQAGVISIDFGGQNQSFVAWSVDEFSNVDTSGSNGSGAIVQSVAEKDETGNPPLIIDLATFGNVNNAAFGAFGISDQAIVGAGFTALGLSEDVSVAAATEYRPENDISIDMDWETAANQVGGIGVEIKAAAVSESISPSLSPSVSVSLSPSLSPSISVSLSPSISVSLSPSISPSISLSASPSVSPSESISPSLSPSVSVSLSPSLSPSISVSLSPSISVSLSPSISPSISLSVSPSVSPSESISPSLSPSVSVSLSPSLSPSISVRLSTSISVSLSPSISPSISLSVSPSVSPSESISPSLSPSVSVSLSPSLSPSISVSLSPSISV